MDVGALAAVVLGAILATAGGIGTELWRQKRATRTAARLVWLEIITAYGTLLASIAQGEWPADLALSDEAWKAQRDRLALGRSAAEFRQLQAVYIALAQLAKTPPEQRADPVMSWPLLVLVDRSVYALGEAAGIEKSQLEMFRSPLGNRLTQVRTSLKQFQDQPEAFDEVMEKALDNFPPELRARAAEVFARQRPSEPKSDVPTSDLGSFPPP
jgi:hypothetical protein